LEVARACLPESGDAPQAAAVVIFLRPPPRAFSSFTFWELQCTQAGKFDATLRELT
jgi:hypothetical protein